ncbi:DUF2851 family protein [Tenacibaculum sp. MEBiC06402]|uniref:DUF2851 family protein n=1 Tax=unclassified Tenacibaculum TaxID=2635139 RepID=UPI003B9BF559
MKEKFLHYLWRYKLLLHSKLITSHNERISVINSGVYNMNSGPDFLNAKIEIDGQLWVGNIEIHVKASDWYLHHHENDTNYDAVILHVVWENDADIYMKNNQPIPTLELKNRVDPEILNNYRELYANNLNWIACENQIGEIDSFLIENWLERLYFERLENKATIILSLLKETNNDYEAVLFQMLAKNFGLKVNGEAFLKLSKSFGFKILRKVRQDKVSLAALMFGQAGFLNEDEENSYFKKLSKEFEYMKHKYELKPISKNHFQFFRMRPNNFPTVRIAQLIALYSKHQNLFAELIRETEIDRIYDVFDITLDSFWKSHYTFRKESKKSSKKLSKSFVDLLVMNTIIPLKFVYLKEKGNLNPDELLEIMKSLKPERNSIISKFEKMNITSENSFKTQALLELKNNYCNLKRCLDCAIGSDLLKKNSKYVNYIYN